jgi:hypothetical protein
MKRLPIYGLLLAGYTIIIVGVVKFSKGLNLIETVEVTEQHTSIKIIPLLILSVFLLVILPSVGLYLITALWKYFKEHKTMIIIPFLLVAIGFLQFAINLMTGFQVMIASNADLFIGNLNLYISSCTDLVWYTVIGLGFIVGSVGYSFYLKFTA